MNLYRNDSCFGSEERNIFEVIRYEVMCLWNTDILKYCLNNYPLSPSLNEALKQDIHIIDQLGEAPDDIDDDIRNLISELSSIKGKNLKFVLWLTEKENVIELYEGNDGNISSYEISDVILSDLGPDGKLYAYESMLEPTDKLQTKKD